MSFTEYEGHFVISRFLGSSADRRRPMCSVSLTLSTHRKKVISQMVPSRPDILGMASAHSLLVSEHPPMAMLEQIKGD